MKRTNSKNILSTLAMLSLLIACQPQEEKNLDQSENGQTAMMASMIESGDIIVANLGTDTITILDNDGRLKLHLYQNPATMEIFAGMAWIEETKELLVAVDGKDRIMSFSAQNGVPRNYIVDNNLEGNLAGMTRMENGDLLIIEDNTIERFSTDNKKRETHNDWPNEAIQNNPESIDSLINGGFVLCSSGSKVVRTYNEDGEQTATVSSHIEGATRAYGCVELSNGNIAVSWNGTQDAVVIYSADFSEVLATYSDQTKLYNPKSIAELENGNIVVADSSLHHLVEIDPDGNFVQLLGIEAELSFPGHILVIP
jgi:hypothetical protein